MNAETYIFEMVDDEGLPRHIFYGDDPMVHWNRRHQFRNRLSNWLQTLSEPPRLEKKWLPKGPVRINLARSLARSRRAAILKWSGGPGLLLLPTGNRRRPVALVGAGGSVQRFAGLTVAGRHLGLDRTTVLDYLERGLHGLFDDDWEGQERA